MLESLIAADIALFLYINKSLSHPVLDFLMPLISHLGSVWLWAPAGTFIVFYRKLLGKRILLGLVSVTVLVVALKELIGRHRPFEVLGGVNTLDTEFLPGFPSGHTTIAFIMAFLISKEFPQYRIPLYALAVLVGFSRIYVGMHFPLDVVAGMMFGISMGYVVLDNLPDKKRKRRRKKR